MAVRTEQRTRRGPQVRGLLTREKILDAVLELVALEGPRAVTYRAVAEKAGVAQGVMTYHFASRRELLSGAFALHLERLRAAARDLPLERARTLSPHARTQLVLGFVKNMVETDRVRYLAEFELMLELARDPGLRKEVAPETDVTRAFASELLSASGSPRPREDAMLVSAAIQGLVLEWLARPGDRAFERQVGTALRRLLELFFPDHESV